MSQKTNINSHKKKYSSTPKNSRQYFFKIKYWNKNILSRSGEIWANLSDPQPDHETMILHIKKIKVNYKVQFSINLVLKNEIEKNQLKNWSYLTEVMRLRYIYRK